MQVKELIKKYETVVAKRGGEPFHAFVLRMFARDVYHLESMRNRSEKWATESATKFLGSCRDVNSNEYLRFRTEFGNNEVTVKKHFLLVQLRREGYYTAEDTDRLYESRVLRGLRAVTPEDHEVVELFTELMLAKWAAYGYAPIEEGQDDYAVVTAFWAANSLSSDPVPGILKTPELLKRAKY